MASYTPPVLHATADVLAVTDWNGVGNDITYLAQKPYCNYYNSVSTSLPNNTNTQITLGGTISSAYGFSVSSNNVIVPLAGAYWVVGSIYINSPSFTTGYMEVEVDHNGSLTFVNITAATSSELGIGSTSGVIVCSAGDNLALYCTQTCGSTVTTSGGAGATYLSAFFIGSV